MQWLQFRVFRFWWKLGVTGAWKTSISWRVNFVTETRFHSPNGTQGRTGSDESCLIHTWSLCLGLSHNPFASDCKSMRAKNFRDCYGFSNNFDFDWISEVQLFVFVNRLWGKLSDTFVWILRLCNPRPIDWHKPQGTNLASITLHSLVYL